MERQDSREVKQMTQKQQALLNELLERDELKNSDALCSVRS